MGDTKQAIGNRQNYVLFTDGKFIGEACLNLQPRLRVGSFLKLSVALGYSPTGIPHKEIPNMISGDLGKKFFADKEKIVVGGVPVTSKSWIMEHPSLDFANFRVYHLLRMGAGIIKQGYNVFIVSEAPGNTGKSHELFKTILSKAGREPISDDDFNVKLNFIRQDIRERVGNLEGVEKSLWPSL